MRKIGKKQPLVSIIIPVYNGSPFLEETVSSIQKSKYRNFEVILVDDGSTDESKKLCRKLEKRYRNVRFFGFNKNQGMTRVLNYGIKKAVGEFIARINQDDLLLPNRLGLQLKFLKDNPDHVAVGGAISLFSRQNDEIDTIFFPLTDEAIRKQWLSLSPFSDPTVMYRKSAFLQTNGYSQDFWPADDVHMWYQLGKIGKLANLPKVVTRVRWHKGAGSIKGHRLQIKKTWVVHKWAKEFVEKPDLKTRLFWVMEYLAGSIFPPQFNWAVYRLIRDFQFRFSSPKTSPIVKTAKLTIQPIAASLSGQ